MILDNTEFSEGVCMYNAPNIHVYLLVLQLGRKWLVAVSGYDQGTTHTHLLVISSSDSALCLWLSRAALRGPGQPSQLSLQAVVHAACPTHSQWEASGFIDGFRVAVQEDDS